MKKLTLWVLALVMVLSLTGCGSSEKGNNSTDSAVAVKQTDAEDKTAEKSEKSETVKEEREQQPTSANVDLTMIEAANSNVQTWLNTMAFDEDYIYFMGNYDRYRCRYDGSDVQKLELDLGSTVTADGTLWGYWHKAGFDEGGIYSMDPKTEEMTMVTELPSQNQLVVSILVSENWLCYTADRGKILNVRDLTTGVEKTIKNNYTEGNQIRDIPMCIYGNTLYVFDDGILYSYELGSDASGMTSMNDSLGYVGKDGTVIWTDDGLYFVYNDREYQYYHARFADLKDNGKWDCKKEENKVGTDMLTEGSVTGIAMNIDDNANSKYVLGNDLLVIGWNNINYYKDFDFTEKQTLIDGEFQVGAFEASHGMHDGSVYYYVEKTGEILKISEGGKVERIPVAMP